MKGTRIAGGSRRRLRAAVAIAVLGALVSAAAGGARSTGPSWTVKLRHGGTFTLAPSIQAKVKAGKAINYVFSYQSCVIQGFSQQYQAGYKYSVPAAGQTYPLNGKIICPGSSQPPRNGSSCRASGRRSCD